MVKSNKFDYTGRTSSGPKLGRSIAADLQKRADKKQKEALKTSARLTFKSHFPPNRTNKKEKLRDEEPDQDEPDASKHDLHKLDLKVPGKSLGDEGFTLLCDGLENALVSCQDLALIDFNATDNGLTTRSLARLAPIIRQSKFNLQTLDLSWNNFHVTTTAAAQDWECFLSAFHDCMTLRRVDLSNNPFLGPWALEVLARVYNREPPVDPLSATGTTSMITLPDDEASDAAADDENGQDYDTYAEDGEYLPRSANGKTLADTWDLGYRRGLKSLPYLTLTNIGLTDTGALFLSYVIEQHYYPTQLISEINATESNNLSQTYRQDANLKGIDWDNNSDTLGKDGLYLLQCAERHRARQVLDDCDSFTGSAYEIIRPLDAQDLVLPKKPHSSDVRRPSLRSMHSVEYSTVDKSDIDSARKKIQRSTIVQAGCRSVQLWHAALKIIAYSRLIYTIAPNPRKSRCVRAPSSEPFQDLDSRGYMSDAGSMESFEDVKNSFTSLSLRSSLSPIEESHLSKRSYAATLATSSPCNSVSPEVPVMTDVTNTSIFPKVHIGNKTLSTHRKDSSSPELQHDRGNTSSSPVYKGQIRSTNGSIERDNSRQSYLDYQARRMCKLQLDHGGQSDGYRDVAMRCQVPLPVCVNILGHAMDSHQFCVLSLQQQRTAIAWGQKHETLRLELDWRRKDESSQILMMLAGAECVDC